MRILISVDPEIPVPPKHYGGIERVVNGLIRELRSRKHQVGLVANGDSSCEVDFFRAWSSGTSSGIISSFFNSMVLWRASHEFKATVIHSFSRLAYLSPLLRSRTRKVMSYQRHTGGKQIRLASQLAGKSLCFTGCSEHIAAQGRKCGGEWYGIPNFIDPKTFVFQSAVANDAPLVFLSRLERIKGVHSAISMAKQAGRRLIIAGNLVNGSEHQEYWEREIAPHIGDKIEYVGPVDDVQKNKLLGEALALIVPIEWDEPFGIVFTEALACGTPVVSSPRGALPEIIEHGVHGFLVQSIEEGVHAIGNLSTIHRKDCRKRVELKFTDSVVTSQYEKLYQAPSLGVVSRLPE